MTASNPMLANGRLRRNAPKTLAGYRRFREVIERDSALPGTIKRLFLAAAACTKGYTAMARQELSAAAVSGHGSDRRAWGPPPA